MTLIYIVIIIMPSIRVVRDLGGLNLERRDQIYFK